MAPCSALYLDVDKFARQQLKLLVKQVARVVVRIVEMDQHLPVRTCLVDEFEKPFGRHILEAAEHGATGTSCRSGLTCKKMTRST